jgi:bifunctional non-homologous end joining protein LigD
VITHPEKILFPDDGITKGELAAYYEMVAPSWCRTSGRVRSRWSGSRPASAARASSRRTSRRAFPLAGAGRGAEEGRHVHHPDRDDTRSLLWLANQNSITPHVWTSRAPRLFHPDICVFDLDPSEGEDPGVLRAAALALRDLLDELGLPSWVKTSGSKGFHIVVPLDGKADFERSAAFAGAVGAVLVRATRRT